MAEAVKALSEELEEDVEFSIMYDEKLAQKHNKKLQKLLAQQEQTEKKRKNNRYFIKI